MEKWLLYGAYGFTGELIAREAAKRGLSPILAGRNAQKLEPLADELGLEMRTFPLDAHAPDQLADISLVLHCAGPFSKTSQPMMEACLSAGAHYLDITGEIDVFEQTHALTEEAKQKGIILCSGVGFDVIPTDCTALKLKELMPEAVSLALGFDSNSGISRGTYKTMIEGLGSGSTVRNNGELTPVPLGSQRRTIDYGRGPRSSMGIPWGDVSTAYYTTGIQNISAWTPVPRPAAAGARFLSGLRPVLSSAAVQKTLKRWVDERVSGPDEELRSNSPAFIWGEAQNAEGLRKVARLQTANVYDLTVYGALECVSRLLAGKFTGGSYTPSMLFGSSLVEELPGSGTFEIDTFYP
ncbi:Putative trans-acting enoyl reductase [Planococcus massiliensis]|uniref:Putative trans-acting enoyl reductase n=1 Tax=Planococcus massiliensis TaxID=1499687 RepID=A0A098ESE1_9BACL|nr:saccharopine dehydrogenase NADP-binding domain-containing protein [Planococcus massiliensis]CEG24236.1 Putative trans-acting enoyl reductase [Planococcus massiliensis]